LFNDITISRKTQIKSLRINILTQVVDLKSLFRVGYSGKLGPISQLDWARIKKLAISP